MFKYVTILILLIAISANIYADEQKKLDDIIDTLSSIKVEDLSIETIKQIEAKLESIQEASSELQKKAIVQKNKLEQENVFIAILTKAQHKKKNFIVTVALSELERNIKNTQDYFAKVKKNKITNNHEGRVKKCQEDWQKLHGKLQELQKLVVIVESANEDLKKQSFLKDDILRKKITGILQSIETYDTYLQKHSFSNYQSISIKELQTQLKKRLKRSAYSSKVKLVRNAHQTWKESLIADNYEQELKAMGKFEKVFDENEKELNAGSENNFFSSVITPLKEEINKRRDIVKKESDLFLSIEKQYKSIDSVEKNPLETLSLSQKTSKKITEYENSVQKNEISRYHRSKVTSYGRKLDKVITTIKLEIERYESLKKEFQSYKDGKYTKITEEKSKIDETLKQVFVYANTLQTGQIKGHYKDNVKKITEEIQVRQQKIIAEQNAISPFNIASKKWESEIGTWAIAKKEIKSIEKVISAADRYLKLSSDDKISNYNLQKVKKAKNDLTIQLSKIENEKDTFLLLEKINTTYNEKKDFSLEIELADLSTILESTKSYNELATKKQITNYYASEVENINLTLKKRQSLLEKEKILYADALNSYELWEKSSKNIAEETNLLEGAKKSASNYNASVANFKSTQYHRTKVLGIDRVIKARKEQIDREKKLFIRIETQSKKQQPKSLKQYQGILKNLQILLDEYNTDIASKKISDYHKKEIDDLSSQNKVKIESLNKIITSFKKAKSVYSRWARKTRWQSWEKEDKKLDEITLLIKNYRGSLNTIQDANEADTKKWERKITEQKQKLQKEKKLIDSLKDITDTIKKGDFASGEEELKEIEKVLLFCDTHKKDGRRKIITRHYGRVIKLHKRKAEDASKKIKKEIYLFDQVRATYSSWKNKTPWENKSDEGRSMKKCFKKIEEYNDELQFRKITTYQKNTVKKYKEELEKRKLKMSAS